MVRLLSVVAVALVAVVVLMVPRGEATAGATCLDGLGRGPQAVVADPGVRLPIVVVHGWRSSASVWDGFAGELSVLGDDTYSLSRFDYSHVNEEWVTHPDIGPRLGEWVSCLAEVSRASGGPGVVALVGHSMGGLVIRAALDGDAVRAGQVAFVGTLGTPHTGSILGGDWVPDVGLPAEAGAYGKLALEWAAMEGPAKSGLGPGSAELAALPGIPAGPPVMATAGNIVLETRVMFWTHTQPVGDGLVGEGSATAESALVGKLGGTAVHRCPVATTLTDIGILPGPFSAPALILKQINDYAWSCIHTRLPHSLWFTSTLIAQLAALPLDAPAGDDFVSNVWFDPDQTLHAVVGGTEVVSDTFNGWEVLGPEVLGGRDFDGDGIPEIMVAYAPSARMWLQIVSVLDTKLTVLFDDEAGGSIMWDSGAECIDTPDGTLLRSWSASADSDDGGWSFSDRVYRFDGLSRSLVSESSRTVPEGDNPEDDSSTPEHVAFRRNDCPPTSSFDGAP